MFFSLNCKISVPQMFRVSQYVKHTSLVLGLIRLILSLLLDDAKDAENKTPKNEG